MVDCTPLPICFLRRIVQVLRAIQHSLDVLVAQLYTTTYKSDLDIFYTQINSHITAI